MAQRKVSPKETVAAKATPAPRLCLCGCGAEVAPRRSFRQGHDQRLVGLLARGEVSPESNTEVAAFATKHEAKIAKAAGK